MLALGCAAYAVCRAWQNFAVVLASGRQYKQDECLDLSEQIMSSSLSRCCLGFSMLDLDMVTGTSEQHHMWSQMIHQMNGWPPALSRDLQIYIQLEPPLIPLTARLNRSDKLRQTYFQLPRCAFQSSNRSGLRRGRSLAFCPRAHGNLRRPPSVPGEAIEEKCCYPSTQKQKALRVTQEYHFSLR